MLMRMLHKGGVEPYCDPESLGRGYEAHATLGLPRVAWLESVNDKAVKVLDPHRHRLPDDREYAVILMTRDLREQAKSHQKFSAALQGKPSHLIDRRALEKTLRRDSPLVRTALSSLTNARLLSLDFSFVLAEPLQAAQQIAELIAMPFDIGAAAASVHKRSPKCLPYIWEATLQ